MSIKNIYFYIISVVCAIFSLHAYGDKSFALEQKRIIIIVPSYNNQAYYQKNLDSIFSQKYDHYQVIYIDDCSCDQTAALVEQYINDKQLHSKIQLIKNTERRGALANIYYAVHSCPDDAIIATLDGDDWFAHTGVLAKLNQVYNNPRVWMTYGSYTLFPDQEKKGCCAPIPPAIIKANAFRECKWLSSLLRTFYAGLFKRISYDDLRYNDAFFPMAWDLAFMFPMLEMCGNRFAYISDILYVYNISNPINDYKVNRDFQLSLEKIIRQKKKYMKLPEHLIHPWDDVMLDKS